MSDLNENISKVDTVQDIDSNGAAVLSAPSPEEKKKSNIHFAVEQLELIAIVLALVVLAFSFFFRTCKVSGPSMENTLYHNEMVIISDFCYTPKKNDIVVFHQTGDVYNEPIVKRVIGLPGDTIEIKYYEDTMQITIFDKDGNTTVLQEDYMKYDNVPRYHGTYVYHVQEGTVFVLGDNRNNSADSRSPAIGPVDTRRILGKLIFRITPFSRFGTVK